MRIRSKGLTSLVAIAATCVLAIGACGGGNSGSKQQSSPGFASCDTKPNDCNSGSTKQGGSIIVALEKTIANWNVGDADGNTLETLEVMNGVLPVPFIQRPDNTVTWNHDLFTEEPKVTQDNPQTVVYKLRKEAVWDDGTPITYKDFELYWKLNNGKDCTACMAATTTGYELIKSIQGSDNDRTVTVTFTKTFPDWKSLFYLYPAKVAGAQGDLTTADGLQKAAEYFKNTPTWSGGPFKFGDYQKDQSITLVRNDKWYGKKAPLDKVIFRIITEQQNQLPVMRNKEIQMLMSQPNQDMVSQVKGMAGVNYNLMAGPTWEHVDLNTKNPTLADMQVRRAIFTAIDRQAIIDKTVGVYYPKAAPLNNHNIMPGMPGYKDVVTATGQGKGDVAAATKILTDAGYKIEGGKLINKSNQPVPALRLRYTVGNEGRKQTSELLQAQLKPLGIDVQIAPTDALGDTLHGGDFDIVLFAWVGTPFLSDGKALWETNGGSNYGKWSNPDADKLMEEAVNTLDQNKVRDLWNQADEIMSKEAYVLPLFQKPVFVAVYSDYINIRNNPTSMGATYNLSEWGFKAQS